MEGAIISVLTFLVLLAFVQDDNGEEMAHITRHTHDRDSIYMRERRMSMSILLRQEVQKRGYGQPHDSKAIEALENYLTVLNEGKPVVIDFRPVDKYKALKEITADWRSSDNPGIKTEAKGA